MNDRGETTVVSCGRQLTAPPGSSASLTRLPDQLPASLQHLELLAIIGYGAYAQVVEVRSMTNGEHYALKVVEKQPLAVRGMLPQLAREFGVQRGVRHPSMVEALELAEDSSHAYLLLNLCVGGSVWQATHGFPSSIVPESLAAHWLCDATAGCAHLHDLGLVHRDVKLENLLIDGEGCVRICDFGWCAFEADQPVGMCGTPQLAAPEVAAGEAQTSKVDAWALGACLVQMLKGRPLNGAHDAWLPTTASSPSKELGSGLLTQDPRLRLGAKMALEVPFLKAVARRLPQASEAGIFGSPVVRRASAPSPAQGHGVQTSPSQTSLSSAKHGSPSGNNWSPGDQSGLRRLYSQPTDHGQRGGSPSPVLGGAAVTQARLAQMNTPIKASTKGTESPSASSNCPPVPPRPSSSPDGIRTAPLQPSTSSARLESPKGILRRPLSPVGHPPQRPSIPVVGGEASTSKSGAVATTPGAQGRPNLPSSQGLAQAHAGMPPPDLSSRRGQPGSSLREAIGAQVMQARAARQAAPDHPVVDDGKASSKAAFDAALEHAVGVLEKQQRNKQSSAPTPETPMPPFNAPRRPLPEDGVSARQEAEEMRRAAAEAFEREEAEVRLSVERAELARHEAEECAIDVSRSARKAKQLVKKVLQAIDTSQRLAATSYAEELSTLDRQSVEDVLRSLLVEPKRDTAIDNSNSLMVARSCGEVTRRLLERSHARCANMEAMAVGAS